MSGISIKSKTITIDKNQASDKATAKKINAFKRSIKPNERIQVTDTGTSITYSRCIESKSQKNSRKLNNFDQNMKSAFTLVRDSLTTKKTGASDESTVAMSNIKVPQPSKSNVAKNYSISIKKFNALVEAQTNQIPVLKSLRLPYAQKHLKNILENITSEKINKSFISQFVSSDDAELKAFVKFAKAQNNGESMNNAVEIKQAINFAKQWTNKANEAYIKKELNLYMSEQTLTALSFVAKALVNFDR